MELNARATLRISGGPASGIRAEKSPSATLSEASTSLSRGMMSRRRLAAAAAIMAIPITRRTAAAAEANCAGTNVNGSARNPPSNNPVMPRMSAIPNRLANRNKQPNRRANGVCRMTPRQERRSRGGQSSCAGHQTGRALRWARRQCRCIDPSGRRSNTGSRLGLARLSVRAVVISGPHDPENRPICILHRRRSGSDAADLDCVRSCVECS